MIETLMQYVGNVAIVVGLFFMFVGAIGLIRLPDFYTRLHATSKTDTLGIGSVFFGLIFYTGPTQVTLKLLLIMFFIFFTSPVASHALAKAAFKGGIKPYRLTPKKDRKDD